MKLAPLAALFLLTISQAMGLPNENAEQELLAEIRSAVPQGWQVQRKPGTAMIVVTREDYLLGIFVVINMSGDEKPKPLRYEFALGVHPLVSQQEYQHLQAENVVISEKLERARERIEKMGVKWQMTGFEPRTAEEREAVAKYEAIDSRSLPDFYWKEFSIECLDGRDGPSISLTDRLAQADCERVRRAVLSRFHEYPSARSP